MGENTSVAIVVGPGEFAAPVAIALVDCRMDVLAQLPLSKSIIEQAANDPDVVGIVPIDLSSALIMFSTGATLRCIVRLDMLGLSGK